MQLLLRIVSGSVFLFVAATNQQMLVALVQLLLLVCLLIFQLKATDAVKRASTLLLWIVVPILVTHALFTPGEMIFPGYGIPVTVEGMKSGAWFSLRLMLLFFSAMLLFRLLSKREWYRILIVIPRYGSRLLTYILLLEHSRREIGFVTRETMKQWKESGGGAGRWIAGLAGLPAKVLGGSSTSAESVWKRWDDEVAELGQSGKAESALTVKGNMIVATAAGVLVALLAMGMWR